MTRVLHIVEQLSGTGGTPRKLLSLVRHSQGSAVRHDFICFLPGDLDASVREGGAQVHVVHSVAAWRIVSALLRLVLHGDVDVLSTHFSRAFACGYLVSRLCRIPLIHNEHGPALAAPVERIARNPLAGWWKRRFMKNADAIVCNSTYTADTVRQQYALPPEKLRVIHNPVESRAALQPDAPARAENVVLGHVGGMIAVRDQATLLRALALLRAGGVDAELELVGDGPVRPSLEQLTAELGLQSHVFFRGYRTDLADFFARTGIYCNPAVAEGFGIAVVEAMLAGIPVVLADAGAHRELVDDGAAGLLHQPRDPADLCRMIGELVRSAELRQRMAHSGREFAQRAFAPQRYAAAYAQLVLQIVAARHRPTSVAGIELQG